MAHRSVSAVRRRHRHAGGRPGSLPRRAVDAAPLARAGATVVSAAVRRSSGTSPITRWSGSTCISRASRRRSLFPRRPLPRGARFRRGAARGPYTKEELRAYLAAPAPAVPDHAAGADGRAGAPACRLSLVAGQPISYLELQLYNLRHIQEHAAQLSLFLGQHAISETELGWVPRAEDGPGSR